MYFLLLQCPTSFILDYRKRSCGGVGRPLARRRGCDVITVGPSYKVKRPHEDKVRLMLSAFTDKSGGVASTTATPVTASSLVMDEKALKVVDLNRQLSAQNVADIHERICREMPVPPVFVEKLVAFHFGQLTLTVENLIQFFLFLESRFRRFAHSLHAFQNLGEEDREILLTANAPYYFQVILIKNGTFLFCTIELDIQNSLS